MPVKTRKPPFFRRNYLIYPRPQLSIVLYLVMIFWLVMALLDYGLTRTMTAIDMEAIRVAGAQTDLLMQLHRARIASLDEFFVGFVLIATVIMIVGGIFLSHRIVGPVYRIRMILEQWSRGVRPYPLKCRDADFFQDLFPILEKLVLKDFDEHTDD